MGKSKHDSPGVFFSTVWNLILVRGLEKHPQTACQKGGCHSICYSRMKLKASCSSCRDGDWVERFLHVQFTELKYRSWHFYDFHNLLSKQYSQSRGALSPLPPSGFSVRYGERGERSWSDWNYLRLHLLYSCPEELRTATGCQGVRLPNAWEQQCCSDCRYLQNKGCQGSSEVTPV